MYRIPTRPPRRWASAALALTVVVSGALVPTRAPADDGGASGPVITVVFTAFRIFRNRSMSAEDVEKLVREILGAVSAVQNETIGQIDGLEAATVIGNAQATSYDMLDYPVIRDDEEMRWETAQRLGGYATNAYAKYGAVITKKAKDQIGLAANTIYPATLVVRQDAGLTASLPSYEADYRDLNRRIVADLVPTCTSQVANDTPLFITEVRYECVAANGDRALDYQIRNDQTGQWIVGPVDLEALKDRAAINSSWLVAKRVLQQQGG
ncbi:MAG TPA: hypothetical protein VF062_24535 [Candidatus Limnocylindrales bacterium]